MDNLSLGSLNTEAIELLKHHNLLKALIRAEVISNAIKDVMITEEQSIQCWNAYLKQHKINNDVELDNHLGETGLTKDSLKWQIEVPLKFALHSDNEFRHKAEARFLAKKEQLDKVVYSIIRLKDRYIAKELYLRIANNEENFADLASKYSLGPEAKTKGIVGPVPMTQGHPILCEKLRTSQENQLLEPFSIDDWWLVLRLERYEPARFEEATARAMSQELFQEWIEDEVVCKIKKF